MAIPSDGGAVSESVLGTGPDLAAPGGQPAYQRIEHWLSHLIETGTLTAGDRLPREADLAALLQVSRMTLRQALGALEARGVVRRVPGRGGGTFIAEPAIECDITGLAGFTEQLRRGNVRASARVLSATVVAATARVATELAVSRGEDVYEIVRVRRAERRPLALERSYLPTGPFPGLLERRLTGSLYARMTRDYDLGPQSANERLEPFIATDEVARVLDVVPGSALLRIQRTAYAASGQPVEYALDLFRPDRIAVTVRTVAGAGGALRAAPPRQESSAT